MSHNLGPVNEDINRRIGPDSGNPATSGNEWVDNNVAPTVSVPQHGSVKFVILHFTNAIFPGSNRLEIALGNGQTDVFTSSSGADFFTRPIKVTDGGSVEIRYIATGSISGGVTLVEYGQGEEAFSDESNAKTNPDIFLWEQTYREPDFATIGDTRWENVECLSPSTNPLIEAAKSAGIILMMHDGHVSSCSGTLIEPDLFITAGHCADSANNIEARSGSVCFDFATNCDNTRPAGYAPQFFKVKERFKLDLADGYDYALLRLDVPAGGTGITPASIRLDLPSLTEPVFAIHHPNGTVKKITLASVSPRVSEILGDDSEHLRLSNVDVNYGSSGSGLFDANGRYLAVNPWIGLSNSINSIFRRIASPPAANVAREVMIVLDRSGSMNSTGLSGELKIEEAKDAASLFVQLIRNGGGNKMGMVSFSTNASNPVDFTLKAVNAANKVALVGTAPYSGGAVGGLTAGGLTSIGDGLETALPEFGNNNNVDKVILLLTDGLQNTSPMIQDIESQLGTTRLCIIGFGTEANLDGSLLTRLAWDHSGSYSVARDNLELNKFFAICFGEIFENGAVMDPFYVLPADKEVSDPVPVSICEEESISVVLGWGKPNRNLGLRLISPLGNAIVAGMSNVESDLGKTWAYLRVDLPFGSEREGSWKIEVFRPQGPVIFSAIENLNPRIDYFLNVVAKGGAKLKNFSSRKRVYTGDAFFPKLMLQYTNNSIPANIKMKLTLSSPDEGIGNLVVQHGLKAAGQLAGDAIYPRQQALKEIEAQQQGKLITFKEQEFELSNRFKDDFFLEPSGIYAKKLEDSTRKEGHYSFKINASYGEGCESTRELTWTHYVDVGIDPDNTPFETLVTEILPSGKQRVTISFTPKDKYGNFLGPEKGGDLTIFPAGDNELSGGLNDLGNGTYTHDVITDADAIPGIIINQDDRPPIIICPGNTGSGSSTIPIFYFWLLLAILIILLILCFVFCS